MTEAFQYIKRIVRGVGCPVVVAQWHSTGCTSQVSWVQFPATAGLFPFIFASKHLNLKFFLSRQLVSAGNDSTRLMILGKEGSERVAGTAVADLGF